jgi:hypothetical protein
MVGVNAQCQNTYKKKSDPYSPLASSVYSSCSVIYFYTGRNTFDVDGQRSHVRRSVARSPFSGPRNSSPQKLKPSYQRKFSSRRGFGNSCLSVFIVLHHLEAHIEHVDNGKSQEKNHDIDISESKIGFCGHVPG